MTDEVKPLPYLFCQGCMFNGCYPWNDNPLLLCGRLGGLLLGIMVTEMDNTPRRCLDFKTVTEELWQTHLADLKKEAEQKELIAKKEMEE